MAYSLRVSGIVPESIVDGPGIRYAVFVQGCPHRCPGCHNPQTHDFEGGQDMGIGEIAAQIEENPLLTGVTFSGGEPFCQAEALYWLGLKVKAMGKNLIIYTGYTIEQLLVMEKRRSYVGKLLRLADTLIDGPYVESLRDLDLPFRGSSNQRIIDVKEYFSKQGRGEQAERESGALITV
ncbi:MAG: anaerobic ribonucleoside-triphosphate reductase activating protein [Clostridiales bacterium]|nr:anaerobic ribonucleoside-triphosphate reductase activating protein [Clostridiales bacterium]